MATDATGTPTAKGIPKYNTSVDAPSGLGFNATMDFIDSIILKGSGTPAAGNVPVWDAASSSWKLDGSVKAVQSGIAFDAWQAYVPVWTAAGVAPALGNGTLTGKYVQLGKTIMGRIALVMGSTSTFGTGSYMLSLPPVAASGGINVNGPLGAAIVQDASPNNLYAHLALLATSTTMQFESTTSPGALMGTSTPITFATGDLILVNFSYEAA